MRQLIILALAATLLAACGQKKEIPYEIAHNYFVRNDVTALIPAKIVSLDEFERYFGVAAFMGKNGQPTPIDFEKQFAITTVLPETNHSTELPPSFISRNCIRVQNIVHWVGCHPTAVSCFLRYSAV